MNPNRETKRVRPERLPSLNENLDEKALLRDKHFFAPETVALVESIARLARENAAPASLRRETPLQQFGALAAAARIRRGLAVDAVARAAGLDAASLRAIELGSADAALVLRAVTPLERALREPRLSRWLARLTLGD